MGYHKFKAEKLFDGYKFQEEKVLITDENGRIEAIMAAEEAGEDVQKLEGILSPGLVNCHCHLELSHLKNVIPPHTGLIDFLCSVVTKRAFPREIIDAEIIKAKKQMYSRSQRLRIKWGLKVCLISPNRSKKSLECLLRNMAALPNNCQK